MKGVIPTPDIAKIFHPTPNIQAKKCPTPTQNSHFSFDVKLTEIYYFYQLDTVIFKSTPETVKYLTSTLDTDPPFKGPINVIVT